MTRRSLFAWLGAGIAAALGIKAAKANTQQTGDTSLQMQRENDFVHGWELNGGACICTDTSYYDNNGQRQYGLVLKDSCPVHGWSWHRNEGFVQSRTITGYDPAANTIALSSNATTTSSNNVTWNTTWKPSKP